MTTDYIDKQFDEVLKEVENLKYSYVEDFMVDLNKVLKFIENTRDEITEEMERSNNE